MPDPVRLLLAHNPPLPVPWPSQEEGRASHAECISAPSCPKVSHHVQQSKLWRGLLPRPGSPVAWNVLWLFVCVPGSVCCALHVPAHADSCVCLARVATPKCQEAGTSANLLPLPRTLKCALCRCRWLLMPHLTRPTSARQSSGDLGGSVSCSGCAAASELWSWPWPGSVA